jgi:hypothetical protein
MLCPLPSHYHPFLFAFAFTFLPIRPTTPSTTWTPADVPLAFFGVGNPNGLRMRIAWSEHLSMLILIYDVVNTKVSDEVVDGMGSAMVGRPTVQLLSLPAIPVSDVVDLQHVIFWTYFFEIVFFTTFC